MTIQHQETGVLVIGGGAAGLRAALAAAEKGAAVTLVNKGPVARSGITLAAAGGMQATARLSGQTAGAVASSLVFHAVAGPQAPQVGLFVATTMAALGALLSVIRVATRP